MRSPTIVILGGALSGPTAAARAREIDGKARIILLEQGAAVGYGVGGLAYHVSGEVPSLQALARKRASVRDVYRVDIRTGVSVQRIDAEKHVLLLEGKTLAYDRLIYAAGAESIVPDIPGLAGGAHVFPFCTPQGPRGVTALLESCARA